MSVFTKGATALITGGSSGIGYAVAQRCLKHGMKTAIVDINPTTLQYAKENLAGDGEVETYQVDVSQESDWKNLKEAVEIKFGGDIDFLMLNAGVGTKGTWWDSEYFQKVCKISPPFQAHLLLVSNLESRILGKGVWQLVARVLQGRYGYGR